MPSIRTNPVRENNGNLRDEGSSSLLRSDGSTSHVERSREAMLARIEQIDAALARDEMSAVEARLLGDERSTLSRELLAFSDFSITPRPPSALLTPPSAASSLAIEVNLANDPGQRVRFTGGDTLSISGDATGGGIIPSMICLTIAGTRIRLAVVAGDSAQQTAERLIAALPEGFTAQLRGADPVRFTVQRR
ncbi:MAG: hypothetical protein ACT4TC_13715 [Myxococcaceae bacterium]